MVGNTRADLSGDIHVEFEYNNIIVVDPNKTIDSQGNIRERLVDHENLVMFANLEADVLPRTKLAVGGTPSERIQTLSVAKINFLKPTKNTYLSDSYYDELTGNNTTQFQGQNQSKEILDKNAQGEIYKRNTVRDEQDVLDNGLLGITSIDINTSSSFVPSVTMQLEDVQGRALFLLGDNSPYAAFFNLPYPQFYLTLKGYYGQAIRYQLNLEKFSASYNSFSGNYQIRLEFRGYKFNILNEIVMGHLLATPHMYGQVFTIASNPDQLNTTNSSSQLNARTENKIAGVASNSNSDVVTEIISERGYQKIKEVYSVYKSKGLVPIDLPELTLVQLMNKLENFENFIINSYPKANLEPLTNIRDYKNNLKQYFDSVRGAVTSWYVLNLNPNPIVLLDKTKVYSFKENFSQGAVTTAKNELKSLVEKFNSKLDENPTLGKKGRAPIPNKITYDTFFTSQSVDSIDWTETTRQQTGILVPSNEDEDRIKSSYGFTRVTAVETNPNGGQTIINQEFVIFEQEGGFNKQIASMETQANKKLSEYETKISVDLANRLEDSATGLGFKPTVRNMIGVIMASAEAFIRLMDEVHTNAWNLKYHPIRKTVVLDNPSSAPSSDSKGNTKISTSASEDAQGLSTAQQPVYPWPQFFVETNEDKKGRFQLRYLGDPTVVDTTSGFMYSVWPEVEFVEEYLKGITQKFNPPVAPPPLDNQQETTQININVIEFPQTGISYLNKEEVKFFYEIWERQFLTAHYSGLVRGVNQYDKLIELNVETEVNNIREALGLSSPYLTLKLKNFKLTSSRYEDFLSNISNSGTGRSYQDFIRDFFVTPYIRVAVEDSFGFYSITSLGKISQFTPKTEGLELLAKSDNNTPLVIDTLPFTNSQWVSQNMVGSTQTMGDLVYQTKNVLQVFEPKNILANFGDVYNFTENRPVTNFSYLNIGETPSLLPNYIDGYYASRLVNPDALYPTEGYISFINPSNIPSFQTTSMINTPFFVNAIQSGVYKQRRGDKYPYVEAAYLFLNSLPLSSLREKYKTYSNNTTSEKDYIFSVFKKYGAIHKLPYSWILKIGSIWYRYKKYIETGEDILDAVWKDFDYVKNYSPIENKVTQTYSFEYAQKPESITLINDTFFSSTLDVGFYPKVITDYNYFYNGFDLFSGYTSEEVQQAVNNGMKIISDDNSQIIGASEGVKSFYQLTKSVLVPKANLVTGNIVCNPLDNTVTADYFIIPSFGTTYNQTRYELIENISSNPSVITNPTTDKSVYNGSIRSLWAMSNFGYFDAKQMSKPKFDEYINKFESTSQPSGFRLLNEEKYSKIEEFFSVFDKKILDSFESEFLNFSKTYVDSSGGSEIVTFGESTVDVYAGFRNFQALFKSLMTVPSQKSNVSDVEYLKNTIRSQLVNFGNSLKSFLQYDIIFKYGNPSFYNRRTFDSFRSYLSPIQYVTNPITFNPYISGTLPSVTQPLSVEQSKQLNPDAWTALLLEVGFSTISGVTYSDNGSYITDFFIDNNIEFNVDNVVILSSLIKMYATQKLNNPSITSQLFKNQITSYLNTTESLQNYFLDTTLSRLNKVLPDQQQLPERTIQSVVDGQVSKVELYETFKALNDKWIAGGDFTEKTLFEDILFLDRASRNIGDTILLDIFDLKNMFSKNSLNQNMSVYTFISGILIKNKFTVMNLPAYVNFYNVQDVSLNATPRPEGTLEFANNLWGTFLNVDYRKSGPKMVCFFVGKPSEYLDIANVDFRFRSDAFDMSKISEVPLIENQERKKDWASSNKCVGFNVDIGIRNQNIFYSFSISQDQGKATSESINTLVYMVDQATGRNTATQNVSLYNLYKNRSYQCTIESLGNAMIQPTMYFNLRHVPMFNGPYMILDVKHSIQPGNFTTTFTGVRQPMFDLPSIDNFLQQVNQNLLTKLQELITTRKDKPDPTPLTESQKSDNTIQKADNTKATQNSCVSKLNNFYAQQVGLNAYTSKEAEPTPISPQELANAIKVKTSDNFTLAAVIYVICYVRTYQKESNSSVGKFNAFDNNFATISLENQLNPSDSYFLKTYSCINLKSDNSVPIANFQSLDLFLDFMIARLEPNLSRILIEGLQKYYVCYWPVPTVSPSTFDSDKSRFKVVEDTMEQALLSAQEVKLITKEQSENFWSAIFKSTPTPTPTVAQTTIDSNVCPQPVITSFFPLSATTGQILQINGFDLISTSGVTINGVEVDMKLTEIFNDETIRVTVPSFPVSPPQSGKIIVRAKYGSVTSQQDFTYI